MEDEDYVEPVGAILGDGSGALLDVSLLGVAAELEGGDVVRVGHARVVHDVARPAEKLVLEA